VALRLAALLVMAACGFHAAGSSDAALPDYGTPPDGACGQLATADLASGCADPGPQTCVYVVSCVDACNLGDTACVQGCYNHARSAQSRTWAMSYIACRDTAWSLTGGCFPACQDSGEIGTARCLACLHVCSYGASCTVGCSCGVCAGEYAACYNDR
jgi:hypothetical protein